MATGQMASLGGLLGGLAQSGGGGQMATPLQGGASTTLGAGTGGGSNAQDGINEINDGANTVSNAIGTATSALSGGGGGGSGGSPLGGNSMGEGPQFKKGGGVKKKYTTGGKINLKACGVSTASAGKKNSNW